MKNYALILWMSVLVALLAGIASGLGAFWLDDGQTFEFVTLHGETVEMYGKGIYANDTAFRAPISRGTDLVTLFVAVPLLLVSTLVWRGKDLRARLIHAGLMTMFLYNSASTAIGTMYNPLLLLYIAYFSVSVFTFILAVTAIDIPALGKQINQRMPWRGAAVFLFFAGLSVFVWLPDLIAALIEGVPPRLLGPYTTDTTAILDIGLIFPSVYLAGILMLRRKPLGVVLGVVLIGLNTMIGLIVAMQTVMQVLEGVQLGVGEFAMFVAPFVSLSLIAVWVWRGIVNGVDVAPVAG